MSTKQSGKLTTPSAQREGPAASESQGSEPAAKRQRRSNSPSPEGPDPDKKPPVSKDEEEEEVYSDEYVEEEPEAPLPSHPCTCRCGGCCCHAVSEVKHCVRCHSNYTSNHPKACELPHMFGDGIKLWVKDMVYLSTCCGARVISADLEKGDVMWGHPSHCYSGWHTTNLEDVDPQYNGSSVVRCIVDSNGKCIRRPRKQKNSNELVHDWGLAVRGVDKEDRERRSADLQRANKPPSVKKAEKDFARAIRHLEEERQSLIQSLRNPLNPFALYAPF